MSIRSRIGTLAVTAFLAGIAVAGAAPAAAQSGPDLAVSLQPASARVGETARFTALLQNIGTGPADGAEAHFAAPAGTVFVNVRNSDCATSEDSTRMTCTTSQSLASGWRNESGFDLRIDSAVAYVSTGNLTLTTGDDTNRLNDTAPIRVSNPDGALPGLGSGLPSGSSI